MTESQVDRLLRKALRSKYPLVSLLTVLMIMAATFFLPNVAPVPPILTGGSPAGQVKGANTDVRTNQALVTRVVDGDTIEVRLTDGDEKVRLVGIDTPETVDPRKPVQCFGKEASNRMKSLVADKTVRLESDPYSADRDKYGRLLRYVFLTDGTSVNKIMILEGYAHEYTYDVAYRYQGEFKAAEVAAKQAERGLWAPGVCS